MDTLQSLRQIISVQDIRTRLAEIADKAEGGHSFVVVRHSKPVFKIVPVDYDTSRFANEATKVLEKVPDAPVEERDISDEEIVEVVREVRRNRKKAALRT